MAKYSQKLAIDFRCQYLLHEASAFTLNAILIFYNINLRYFSSLHSRIERQRKSGQISEYCEWTKILGTYRLHLKLKMEIQVWIETTSCLLRKRSKENRLAFSIFFFCGLALRIYLGDLKTKNPTGEDVELENSPA